MTKIYFISIISTLSLNSCFIADEMFLDNESNKEYLSSKVEKEVSKYIKENSENYIYKNYGFSELIIKKPAELVVLDSLKRKQAIDSNQHIVNKQIKTIDSIIKTQNIRYSLEIDHEYSLKNKLTKTIELFETRFTLADSIKVNKIKPLLNLKLTDTDVTLFEAYFYETPIFLAGTYPESKTLSSEFYNLFKQHQEELIDIKQKSNFLKHSLDICKDIKEDGTFDQSYYLLKSADRQIRLDSTIINYKPIEYSPLFETIINERLVNYYFFHSFICRTAGFSDTLSVHIEFSPNYELRSISTPGKTLNTYFND